MSTQSSGSAGKPADYVYFERTIAGFSEDALPRSKAAQLKLEHYYKVAVEAAIERNQRCVLCAVDLAPHDVSFREFCCVVANCYAMLSGAWKSNESSRLIR